MDSKDFRLLVALHENARVSYRSLGHRVSLSAPAVRDRLKRLEKVGVLQGYWLYVDPAVFGREELMVFYDGDWTREDIVSVLSAPDVAFAAWKLDGGATVQLWPEDHRRPLKKLNSILGARPSGQAFTEAHAVPSLSLADWRVIDALLDNPTMSMNEITRKTGLSRKTVRGHLQNMIEEEVIFVMPLSGSLADSGELVYHLAVIGNVGISELRGVLGDALVVGSTDEPPLRYLLCRASDLADVTSRTQKTRKLPGVDSVRVTLNRELLVHNDFVHSLVRKQIAKLSM